MKGILSVALLSLINVKLNFLPTGTLMVAMGACITLDFFTGVIKATFLHEARTSEGYRKTVIKFMQYGGAVCVSMVMKYLMVMKGDADFMLFVPFLDYLNNGLLFFIIFIETTSILENMYAIDKNSPFAHYIIKPLLKLMTFAIKNNSVIEASKKVGNTDDN